MIPSAEMSPAFTSVQGEELVHEYHQTACSVSSCAAGLRNAVRAGEERDEGETWTRKSKEVIL